MRELVPPGRLDAHDRKPDAAIVVAATTGIEGRVLVAGKPMANVSVSVKHVEGLDIYEIQRVSSDEGGHYKLDVTPNPYLVINAFTAKDSEPKSSRSHVTVVDGAYTHLDVELDLAASIEGRIVDPKGTGVAGLDIQLICSAHDDGCSRDGRDECVTETDGAFHCGGINHGDYLVVVRKPR